MTAYRLRNILIAVALAVVAALLTVFYVSNYKESVKKEQQTVPVLVATRDIPVGTLGSQVASGKMVATREIARSAVVPGTISNPAQIRNQIAVEPIYAGEQVTARRFGPVVQQGVRTQLKGTYRAVQLAGDPNQLLAGTLKPGDHVDVVGVLRVKLGSDAGSEYAFGRVVVRDVTVLQTSGQPEGGPRIAPSSDNWVMLRVTDSQAQKLALIYKAGDYWSLALRPSLNDGDGPSSVETPWTLLTDGLSRSKIQRALGVGGAAYGG
jgi:pilus assembly protein CpaB